MVMQAAERTPAGLKSASGFTPRTIAVDSLPGPRAPAWLQTIMWRFGSPLELYRAFGARYGESFRLRFISPPGQPRIGTNGITSTLVVVSSPEQLRAVYAQSFSALGVGAAYRFLERFLGADTALTSDGAPHRDERRLLQPLFAPEALGAYDRLTRDATVAALARVPDGFVSLADLISDVVADAMLAVMLGLRPEKERVMLRRLMRDSMPNLVTFAMMMIPALQRDLGAWSPGGKARRARTEMADWLAAEISRRRAARSPGNDMLGRLIQSYEAFEIPLDAPRINAQIILLLGAALPSASAMAWCCFHAFRDAALRGRVYAAASDESATDVPAFLDAFCRESLRLKPPFVGAVRRATVPVIVGDLAIDAGTYVVPCFYLTHLRPEIFANPLEFRPERFLTSSYSPYEYVPFGGGVRKCLGYPLAVRRMPIILAELLRAFDVRPATRWSSADRVEHVLLMPRDRLHAELRRIRT